ncbi:MAG TPA: hypothetical protein VFO89_05910 [Thermoanaerobaculia bacterium]|nr:hypothetical protein [Thermoanaerobaculia bacterium]
MKSQDEQQDDRPIQKEPPDTTIARITDLTAVLATVFPLPAGVTRADRRRVADVAARFLRD